MLSHFSPVQLCASLWAVAHQAPLSVEFSKQEYWSGLPCSSPGDLWTQRSNPPLLLLPELEVGSLQLAPPGEPQKTRLLSQNSSFSDGLGVARERRQWHPTPVLLPVKSHGWRSLVGCSPWGQEESDTTERLHFHFSLLCIGEGNATHSSVLAWRIPGMGWRRVGHD